MFVVVVTAKPLSTNWISVDPSDDSDKCVQHDPKNDNGQYNGHDLTIHSIFDYK